MTMVLPQPHLHSSPLARCLADFGLAWGTPGGAGFTEALGQWLDFKDAITLYSAQQTAATAPATAPRAASLQAEIDRVASTLARNIEKSCSPQGGATRLKLPTLNAGTPQEILLDYEPYRRFYLAHQREMENALGPLRRRVREALGGINPDLDRLLALDGAFDAILAERESRCLASLPGLLQTRYEQRLEEGREAAGAAFATSPAAEWIRPGAWLAAFYEDLAALLLAELALRMQPIAGLMDALNETGPGAGTSPTA